MSTTFDARDGNAPDAGSPAVALANEETLRRVFLEEFASLTAEEAALEEVLLSAKASASDVGPRTLRRLVLQQSFEHADRRME